MAKKKIDVEELAAALEAIAAEWDAKFPGVTKDYEDFSSAIAELTRQLSTAIQNAAGE
jgi:hypothetical protein